MEHQEAIGINAPSHSAVCFCFELELSEKLIFTMGASNNCMGFEPRFSWLQAKCPTNKLSPYLTLDPVTSPRHVHSFQSEALSYFIVLYPLFSMMWKMNR